MSGRHFSTQAGFTVVEVLMAMTVIIVGLLGTVAGFQHAFTGIETGRGESAATFLVEHKLEELKALALLDWANPALQPGTVTEYCHPAAAPGCSAMPHVASLRRTATISNAVGACSTRCKVVTISVFYRAVTAVGQLDQERRVDASTMFVSRQ